MTASNGGNQENTLVNTRPRQPTNRRRISACPPPFSLAQSLHSRRRSRAAEQTRPCRRPRCSIRRYPSPRSQSPACAHADANARHFLETAKLKTSSVIAATRLSYDTLSCDTISTTTCKRVVACNVAVACNMAMLLAQQLLLCDTGAVLVYRYFVNY